MSRMRLLALVFVALALGAPPLAAQDPPAPVPRPPAAAGASPAPAPAPSPAAPAAAAPAIPASFEVKKVHFRGNRKVEDDAMRVNLRTQEGATLTREMLRDDVRTIWKMGF